MFRIANRPRRGVSSVGLLVESQPVPTAPIIIVCVDVELNQTEHRGVALGHNHFCEAASHDLPIAVGVAAVMVGFPVWRLNKPCWNRRKQDGLSLEKYKRQQTKYLFFYNKNCYSTHEYYIMQRPEQVLPQEGVAEWLRW